MKVEGWARELLIQSRLGHLATSTKHGKPHVVPICYVLDGASLYTPIDEKPKRRKPPQLRRVLNIAENPNVCLVVDHYEEDWSELKYVIVRGSAEIIHGGEAHERAVMLLREKYKQYHRMKLEERPLIKIKPINIIAWNARGI
jgi:coenzyme F420-0:L-glutamate ligase/coenzyme F420-1:gamma-L-glutamate ligase